jgi:hypothetical protein
MAVSSLSCLAPAPSLGGSRLEDEVGKSNTLINILRFSLSPELFSGSFFNYVCIPNDR